MSLDRFDLTNWRTHPTARGIEVFFFKSVEQGDYFEQLLNENEIWYEKDVDTEQDHSRKVMFAVRSNDVKHVKPLNNMAIGKYRKRFIPFKGLRIILFVFLLIMLTLLIVGLIKA